MVLAKSEKPVHKCIHNHGRKGPNCGTTVYHFHKMLKGGFDKQDGDKTIKPSYRQVLHLKPTHGLLLPNLARGDFFLRKLDQFAKIK